jgi:ArsR family transcriptional regulator
MWVFYSTSKNNGSGRIVETLKDTLAKEPHSSDDAARAEQLISDNREAVVHYFDQVAPHWDQLQREIFGTLETGRVIGEAVPVCSSVADLGCGTGALFPYLLEKAATVIGVDSSDKMLSTAGNNHSAFRKRLDLRLGELTHLPLKEREAECAVINMALHHLSAPEECLRDTLRVLTPRGKLIIMDFKKHSDESFRSRFQDRRLGFELEELKKLVTKAGFTNWETETLEVKPALHIVLGTALKK